MRKGSIAVYLAFERNLWDEDPRKLGASFKSVFFHVSELRLGFIEHDLPSREIELEFDLKKAIRATSGEDQDEFQVVKITAVRRNDFGSGSSTDIFGFLFYKFHRQVMTCKHCYTNTP